MPAPNSSSHCEGLLGRVIDNSLPGGPASQLEFLAVLGQGAYGVVYLARDVLARDVLAAPLPRSPATRHPLNPLRQPLYAVKCLNKLGLSPRQRAFQEREIALHARASVHPNVVAMHNVVESASRIYVVLEFCPGGDLFGLIVDEQRFLGNDHLIKRVFLRIVDAVAYSHSLGIYHRDLKPENILASDATGSNVVLADFGLATTEPASTDFGCGSTFYMSPECNGGLYGEPLTSYASAPNDVWALGVILVNLVCGRNPWQRAVPDDASFRALLKDPAFLTQMLPISPQVDTILRRVFALNPDERMGVDELRAAVARVERFAMSARELKGATKATRQAAKALEGAGRARSAEAAWVEVVEAQASLQWELLPEADELDFGVRAPSPCLAATFGPAGCATESAAPASRSVRKAPPTPLTNLGKHLKAECQPDKDCDSASDASASQPPTPTDATPAPSVDVSFLPAHLSAPPSAKDRVPSFLADWSLFARWADQPAC